MPLLANHWLVAGGVFSCISRLCKFVRFNFGGQYIAIHMPILLRTALSRKWIYSIIRIILLREEIQFTLVIAISQLLLPLGDIPSHSIIYNVLVNQFFNTTIFIKSKSTNVCLIWGGPMKSGNRITWPLGRKISDRIPGQVFPGGSSLIHISFNSIVYKHTFSINSIMLGSHCRSDQLDRTRPGQNINFPPIILDQVLDRVSTRALPDPLFDSLRSVHDDVQSLLDNHHDQYSITSIWFDVYTIISRSILDLFPTN